MVSYKVRISAHLYILLFSAKSCSKVNQDFRRLPVPPSSTLDGSSVGSCGTNLPWNARLKVLWGRRMVRCKLCFTATPFGSMRERSPLTVTSVTVGIMQRITAMREWNEISRLGQQGRGILEGRLGRNLLATPGPTEMFVSRWSCTSQPHCTSCRSMFRRAISSGAILAPGKPNPREPRPQSNRRK